MCNLVGGVMTPPYEALNNNFYVLQPTTAAWMYSMIAGLNGKCKRI